MESSMNSLLELHNIYYSYHTLDAETRALSDLSFSVQPGTFTAVVGPSGCGKSTLLSLICGLMKPDAGEILLNGIPLKENSPLIGYMLQSFTGLAQYLPECHPRSGNLRHTEYCNQKTCV